MRNSTWPDLDIESDAIPPHIRRRRRGFVCLLIAVAAVGLVSWLISRPPGAPSLGVLPIAHGAFVADDNLSGSPVQSDINANQYRFVVMAGPPAISAQTFLLAELRAMRNDGWGSSSVVDSSALDNCQSAAMFDDTGSAKSCPQPPPNRHVTTVLKDPLAYVRLRRAHGDIVADVSVIPSRLPKDGTVGVVPDTSIIKLIQAKRPVLLVELGRSAVLS